MNDQYNELYEKLTRLQQLLHRYHHYIQTCNGPMGDPTRGQGRVVALLKIQPEISTKDLTYLLGIRQQSLNELLNKLEKGGFVVREPSESDRRVMMVKLTEKGRAEQQVEPDVSNIFTCLNEEEQEAFAGYLDRIIENLECKPGIDRGGMGHGPHGSHDPQGSHGLHGFHGSGRRHGDREECLLGRHANRRRHHTYMKGCIFN